MFIADTLWLQANAISGFIRIRLLLCELFCLIDSHSLTLGSSTHWRFTHIVPDYLMLLPSHLPSYLMTCNLCTSCGQPRRQLLLHLSACQSQSPPAASSPPSSWVWREMQWTHSVLDQHHPWKTTCMCYFVVHFLWYTERGDLLFMMSSLRIKLLVHIWATMSLYCINWISNALWASSVT